MVRMMTWLVLLVIARQRWWDRDSYLSQPSTGARVGQPEPMTDDLQDSTPRAPAADDDAPSCRPSGRILDDLNMAGVEDVEIAFERPISHPRRVSFD